MKAPVSKACFKNAIRLLINTSYSVYHCYTTDFMQQSKNNFADCKLVFFCFLLSLPFWQIKQFIAVRNIQAVSFSDGNKLHRTKHYFHRSGSFLLAKSLFFVVSRLLQKTACYPANSDIHSNPTDLFVLPLQPNFILTHVENFVSRFVKLIIEIIFTS